MGRDMNTRKPVDAFLPLASSDGFGYDGVDNDEMAFMQAKQLSLQLSPSPPLKETTVCHPSLTSSHKSQRHPSNRRPKARPTRGDAVLIQYMEGNRNPDIAQFAGERGLVDSDDDLDEDADKGTEPEAEPGGEDCEDKDLKDLEDKDDRPRRRLPNAAPRPHLGKEGGLSPSDGHALSSSVRASESGHEDVIMLSDDDRERPAAAATVASDFVPMPPPAATDHDRIWRQSSPPPPKSDALPAGAYDECKNVAVLALALAPRPAAGPAPPPRDDFPGKGRLPRPSSMLGLTPGSTPGSTPTHMPPPEKWADSPDATSNKMRFLDGAGDPASNRSSHYYGHERPSYSGRKASRSPPTIPGSPYGPYEILTPASSTTTTLRSDSASVRDSVSFGHANTKTEPYRSSGVGLSTLSTLHSPTVSTPSCSPIAWRPPKPPSQISLTAFSPRGHASGEDTAIQLPPIKNLSAMQAPVLPPPLADIDMKVMSRSAGGTAAVTIVKLGKDGLPRHSLPSSSNASHASRRTSPPNMRSPRIGQQADRHSHSHSHQHHHSSSSDAMKVSALLQSAPLSDHAERSPYTLPTMSPRGKSANGFNNYGDYGDYGDHDDYRARAGVRDLGTGTPITTERPPLALPTITGHIQHPLLVTNASRPSLGRRRHSDASSDGSQDAEQDVNRDANRGTGNDAAGTAQVQQPSSSAIISQGASSRQLLPPPLSMSSAQPPPPPPPPLQSQQPQQQQPPRGTHRCKEPGCKAEPFLSQYLLKSHAKVHSTERPHYCPVKDCPRSESGYGFKRKNEMIRHGLVHKSPGYVCPFCPDRKHRYPRPDNLQRHVKSNHSDKTKDDEELQRVLAQRPDGQSRGRRRRA